MQYCVDHPEESSKLMQVKAQVSDVKAVMIENIDKVKRGTVDSDQFMHCCNVYMIQIRSGLLHFLQILERGTKIEDLVDKTENLRSQVSLLKILHTVEVKIKCVKPNLPMLLNICIGYWRILFFWLLSSKRYVCFSLNSQFCRVVFTHL